MRLRILGCSGGIGGDLRTTSMLLDRDVLIDAGTGVCDLTLAELTPIDRVFVTHSHLDHVCSIPFLVDTVGQMRDQPITVYGIPATLEILQNHLFNWSIWPDFTQIPSPDAAFLRYQPIHLGETVEIGSLKVEFIPVTHSVPHAHAIAVHTSQGVVLHSEFRDGNVPAGYQQLRVLKDCLAAAVATGITKVYLRSDSAGYQQDLLRKKCKQEMVIEYKTGAGGAIAWQQLNGLPADGTNIMGINLPHVVLQPLDDGLTCEIAEVGIHRHHVQRYPLVTARLLHAEVDHAPSFRVIHAARIADGRKNIIIEILHAEFDVGGMIRRVGNAHVVGNDLIRA